MVTTELTYLRGFSGFAVPDLDAARDFYREVVGLDVADNPMGMLEITLPGGGMVIVYPKEDHEPAVFTILNLAVADIEQAVDVLTERGVEFLRYDGFEQDERGIVRGGGMPTGGWFADPAGNVIAVMEL
ncbi:VOC family protein [Cryobacterium sp. 1639]|uniref:VOC family protein n=1 Tax=Cryobacterium inferilacus TaxID=2866629 RepID=UPI001C730203|nr:VOC family protein [Cryobacterium sp. 1639]MBX0299321.1 VOC family protein [Cryobacterium sp. 1639]